MIIPPDTRAAVGQNASPRARSFIFIGLGPLGAACDVGASSNTSASAIAARPLITCSLLRSRCPGRPRNLPRDMIVVYYVPTYPTKMTCTLPIDVVRPGQESVLQRSEERRVG